MTGEELLFKNVTRVLECSENIVSVDGLTFLGWIMTIFIVTIFYLSVYMMFRGIFGVRSCP